MNRCDTAVELGVREVQAVEEVGRHRVDLARLYLLAPHSTLIDMGVLRVTGVLNVYGTLKDGGWAARRG